MPFEKHPARSNTKKTQRQTLTCTECARRKQRCSRTIPCTSCVDRGLTATCHREPVDVFKQSHYAGRPDQHPARLNLTAHNVAVTHANPDRLPLPPNDSSEHSFTATARPSHYGTSAERRPEAAGDAETVASGSSPRAPPASLTSGSILGTNTGEDVLPKRTRLMNETVSTLEFLAQGRRSILNSQNGLQQRDDAHQYLLLSPQSVPQSNADNVSTATWDTVLSIDEARQLLFYHQHNLAWMHNVIHMPNFIREFESSVTGKAINRCWVALYYAVLSTTLYHASEEDLMALGILCTENLTSAVALYDRSVQCLHDGEFTSKHTVYSAQAICVLLQVAHNFDQSDMIAVLVAAAIKICQCLNVHRLGPDREELTIRMDTDMAVQYLIEREVKKRVWWFLIRQDWLQIPFQNTYLVHASQFNTPMPINCHDNLDRMICDGRVVAQPEQVYTQCSYTHGISLVAVIIWKHQDRMCNVGHPAGSADGILNLYTQVIWADKELREIYTKLPAFLKTGQDFGTTPSCPPHVKQQASITLLSMAHKVLTVHRHFQLESFRDRRFGFTQLSCLSIAEKCVLDIESWPDDSASNQARKIWTVITHLITCCVILIFASIFRGDNTLLYDGFKMRHLAEVGRASIRCVEQASSIARRGGRMLDALLDLDNTVQNSIDVQFDIGDIIRKVSSACETAGSEELPETASLTLPWNISSWNALFGQEDVELDWSQFWLEH